MPTWDDGPLVDTRPPGFGCTYSLGPIGPSRLLIKWASGTQPDPLFNNGLVIGWISDDWSLPGNGSVWMGFTEACYYTVELRLDDPDDGLWTLTLLVEVLGGGDNIFYSAEFTNFTWGPAANTLASLVDDDDRATIRRLPEWFKVSSVYPEATLANKP